MHARGRAEDGSERGGGPWKGGQSRQIQLDRLASLADESRRYGCAAGPPPDATGTVAPIRYFLSIKLRSLFIVDATF